MLSETSALAPAIEDFTEQSMRIPLSGLGASAMQIWYTGRDYCAHYSQNWLIGVKTT